MAASRAGWAAGGLLGALGAFALLRPSLVRGVRLVQRAPGRVEIALQYGLGARPVSVVVDVAGELGNGSTTVSGEQFSVEVPFVGDPDGALRVTLTAAYRVLGVLRTRVLRFEC